MITALEIIDGAKECLLTEGWTKGVYHLKGKYCAVGALRYATYGSASAGDIDYDDMPTYNAYIKAWKCLDRVSIEKGYGEVINYNDAETTQLGDILSLMDEAKECAR